MSPLTRLAWCSACNRGKWPIWGKKRQSHCVQGQPKSSLPVPCSCPARQACGLRMILAPMTPAIRLCLQVQVLSLASLLPHQPHLVFSLVATVPHPNNMLNPSTKPMRDSRRLHHWDEGWDRHLGRMHCPTPPVTGSDCLPLAALLRHLQGCCMHRH